jgi:hypothetical protein
MVVHIPLKDGVPDFRTPRDLEVGYWVDQRDPNGRVSFCSNFTQVVHCTSYKRPASFTVFCENLMNLPPTNGLLRKFRNVDGEHIEGGNVLLIKHPLTDVHHITAAMVHETWRSVAITDDYIASRALRMKQYWI